MYSRWRYLNQFFQKCRSWRFFFTCSVMTAKMKSSVAMVKPVKVMMNVQNNREITMKVKSGYAEQYAINGRLFFMSNIYLIPFYYYIILIDIITYWFYVIDMVKIPLFQKHFHNNSKLWLKYLLFHKSFPKNTKLFWACMILCVGWKIKVYIKSIGWHISLNSKDSFPIVSQQ